MQKNYYKILGINEDATSEVIKNAYHKLARKWHPDIASDKDEAISKFKEINEAYQVLSNKYKKSEYDRAKAFYDYAKKSRNINNDLNKNFKNEQVLQKENLFNWKKFFSSERSGNYTAPRKGDDINTEIEISYSDAIYGASKVINILQTGICPVCHGKKIINGNVCKHCNGKGNISNYKKFTIKIPAGIKNRSKLRLAKEGAKGLYGGCNGDLYITVIIKQNDNYQIDGLDIYKKIEIEPYLAILGGSVEVVSFLDTYNIKIAPNTRSGQKIRLSKCGIVQNDKIGDMIITVNINIPSNLTTEEYELYRKLEIIAKEKNGKKNGK